MTMNLFPTLMHNNKIKVKPEYITHNIWLFSAEGCDPNIRHEEESNQCALHAASWSGYHLIVHLLLQAGANPEAQDNHLATPLMLAAEKGHMNVIQILVKSGALVDAKVGETG